MIYILLRLSLFDNDTSFTYQRPYGITNFMSLKENTKLVYQGLNTIGDLIGEGGKMFSIEEIKSRQLYLLYIKIKKKMQGILQQQNIYIWEKQTPKLPLYHISLTWVQKVAKMFLQHNCICQPYCNRFKENGQNTSMMILLLIQ